MSDIKIVRVRVLADEERAANKGKCTARLVIVKCAFDRNIPIKRSFGNFKDAFFYSQIDLDGQKTSYFNIKGANISRAELYLGMLDSAELVPEYLCRVFEVDPGATYGDSARRLLNKISSP